MNPKMKWFLIISGYVGVFVLTFIFTGGLEALLKFFQEIGNLFEGFITPIIEQLPDI